MFRYSKYTIPGKAEVVFDMDSARLDQQMLDKDTCLCLSMCYANTVQS